MGTDVCLRWEERSGILYVQENIPERISEQNGSRLASSHGLQLDIVQKLRNTDLISEWS
jgi:hypothetical protein